jgi:hypothetical protein
MATLMAIRDKDKRDKTFLASLQGVDLNENSEVGDITSLAGSTASKEGFGIGLGLGYIGEE